MISGGSSVATYMSAKLQRNLAKAQQRKAAMYHAQPKKMAAKRKIKAKAAGASAWRHGNVVAYGKALLRRASKK